MDAEMRKEVTSFENRRKRGGFCYRDTNISMFSSTASIILIVNEIVLILSPSFKRLTQFQLINTSGKLLSPTICHDPIQFPSPSDSIIHSVESDAVRNFSWFQFRNRYVTSPPVVPRRPAVVLTSFPFGKRSQDVAYRKREVLQFPLSLVVGKFIPPLNSICAGKFPPLSYNLYENHFGGAENVVVRNSTRSHHRCETARQEKIIPSPRSSY